MLLYFPHDLFYDLLRQRSNIFHHSLPVCGCSDTDHTCHIPNHQDNYYSLSERPLHNSCKARNANAKHLYREEYVLHKLIVAPALLPSDVSSFNNISILCIIYSAILNDYSACIFKCMRQCK